MKIRHVCVKMEVKKTWSLYVKYVHGKLGMLENSMYLWVYGRMPIRKSAR